MNAPHLIPSGKPDHDAGQEALADALAATFRMLRRVMVLVAVLYLFSGITLVEQHQQAFVLRFGKVQTRSTGEILQPGLHWTWPRPFAEVVKIDATRVRTLELFTFWPDPNATMKKVAESAELPYMYDRLDPIRHGYFITGDANILHAVWSLRYRSGDPRRTTFGLFDPEQLVQLELQHAVTLTAASMPAGDALRGDTERFRLRVEEMLASRLQQAGAGLVVERLDLIRPMPPAQVAFAFNDVIAAENLREQMISEARSSAARMSNEALGTAARIQAEARSAAGAHVSSVSSAAGIFARVLERHRDDPALVEQFLRIDAHRTALASAEERIVLRDPGAGGQEIRLDIPREPLIKRKAP